MAIEFINEQTGEIRCAPGARCWVVRTNKNAPASGLADADDLAHADIELEAEPTRWAGREYP